MIVEHAVLEVKPDQAKAFESAIQEARLLIAASPGFVGIEVRPAAEVAGRYLLRVIWTDIDAHRNGFRKSQRYQQWKALLHHFYDPMPEVSYFGESII